MPPPDDERPTDFVLNDGASVAVATTSEVTTLLDTATGAPRWPDLGECRANGLVFTPSGRLLGTHAFSPLFEHGLTTGARRELLAAGVGGQKLALDGAGEIVFLASVHEAPEENRVCAIDLASGETLWSGSLAWLQWAEGAGVGVARADPALHLDTVVDVALPVPGRTDAWLVAGLRAYRATFAGDLPRRFLQVIQVGARPARISGALRVGGRAVDQVILDASGPSTGKFRHHPFASSWFTARDGAVWLTPVADVLSVTPALPASAWRAGRALPGRSGRSPRR